MINEKTHTRETNKKLVNLIAASFVDEDNFHEWIHSYDINCYGFARGLTYPDLKHELYAPGKLHNLKFGTGEYVHNEYDPSFIDKCVKRDSIALGQNCEQVTFDSIKEDDGNFYFAITDFHVIPLGDKDHHWHFICRTQSGMWLHKPNWYQSVQSVNWIEYGKSFVFDTITQELGSLQKCPISVHCEAKCFNNFFYKVVVAED